jgi:hypothetical protein
MGIRNSEDLVRSAFILDAAGNPTGGQTEMVVADQDLGASASELRSVISITWQEGVVPPGGVQNGAFVEDVLEAARQRLLFFNSTKFRCRENSLAITKIEEALQWLDWRTRSRLNQGVENTYETHAESGGVPPQTVMTAGG